MTRQDNKPNKAKQPKAKRPKLHSHRLCQCLTVAKLQTLTTSTTATGPNPGQNSSLYLSRTSVTACTLVCFIWYHSAKKQSLILTDNVVLHTTGANKYAFQILPLLLDGCRSPEASIRQSALYGLGSVAEQRPQLFQAVAQDALTRIMAVITAPNSRYCCHLC